jgi:Glycosyl hydrolase family 12
MVTWYTVDGFSELHLEFNNVRPAPARLLDTFLKPPQEQESSAVRWPRRSLTLLAAPAALLSALMPSPALAGGVPKYNTRVCGDGWVTIRTAQSYFRVYNDDFGGHTCVTAEHYHLDFAISSASGHGFHAYPNISSGWESGRYTCTGHTGSCYAYPVQVKHDGNPVTSIAGWLAPGRYDFSYDIWMNRKDAHPLQDNGTEVMIWLAHPGVREAIDREVTIDGIKWYVTTWIAHRNGATWRLLIYYAVHPRSSARGLRLNDFFHEAERHKEMSANYWLTGIDAGFELVQGGVHNNVHYFSLTGLPVKK